MTVSVYNGCTTGSKNKRLINYCTICVHSFPRDQKLINTRLKPFNWGSKQLKRINVKTG